MTVDTVGYLAIAALLLGGVALLLAVWLALRTRRLSRMSAFRPEMPASLQQKVESESTRLDQLTGRVTDLSTRMPVVEGRAALAVQRVGVVRFNPFEDTGSQQSFAIALLDSRGTGVAISSLHSRQATRVYLKQITAGKSDIELSTEEAEAIKRALAEQPS